MLVMSSFTKEKYGLIVILLATVSLRVTIGQTVTVASDRETIDFQHESCSREIHNSFSFKIYHPAKPFYEPSGSFELFVRFKGIADGHIILTENPNTNEPLYMIIIGSYNNKFSEIRRTKQAKPQVKLSTLGIMSGRQWRGFIIRYFPKFGNLSVFSEGSDSPLLSWIDPRPLDVQYFSFTSYNGRLVEVAYDCKAKDDFSSIPKTKDAKKTI